MLKSWEKSDHDVRDKLLQLVILVALLAIERKFAWATMKLLYYPEQVDE